MLLDVKPDNILLNLRSGPDFRHISEVQLDDCGDVCRFDPNADPFKEGHIIGAAIFRSPEAMLNLRWGPPTDIWSLGATVCISYSQQGRFLMLTIMIAYQPTFWEALAHFRSS